MTVDPIQTYGEARLPRYTSYPTVPCWDRTPTEAEWLACVGAALTGPAAVYVHVPFCRSLCTYCGCNTRITQKAVGAPYVATEMVACDSFARGRPDVVRRAVLVPKR